MSKQTMILHNPFYTDSAHKAYEQALSDLVHWLILHNKAYEVKEPLLVYPLVLVEDDYWVMRQRTGLPPMGK